jgi:thiamine-phosphate pyrophosphorylase
MMLRYAITSRALFSGDEAARQSALLRLSSRWIAGGIDLIQLRERDLDAAVIATLARSMLQTIAQTNSQAKVLISSRADIALATGAHGVHLTSHAQELTPSQVHRLYAAANLPAPIVTISCHTLEDIARARQNGATAILFAPVFEKVVDGQVVTAGLGLDRLSAACNAALPIPVYALGGVTVDNASSCVRAGAAGIAGIRLFHNV